MSILGDNELNKRLFDNRYFIEGRSICVQPLKADSVRPNSIDIRLGDKIKYSTPDNKFLYRWNQKPPEDLYCEFDITTEGIVLYPGQFVLGVIFEYIEVPNDLTCTVEGRSSIGRMGLLVVNAGRVDSGWKGKLTLEIQNQEKFPIMLEHKMPIAQLVFSTVEGVVKTPYSVRRSSKYQKDMTAQESKIYLER